LEIKGVGKSEMAFGNILLADLAGKFIEAAEQMAADVLQPLDRTDFERVDFARVVKVVGAQFALVVGVMFALQAAVSALCIKIFSDGLKAF